jgi:anaerobic ribonucleoside-triphosphate reductase activating protein
VKLFLSRLHFPVTALGYGRRIGLWFQGCTIRCAGCISADTWAAGRGETTIVSVMATMEAWLPAADGLTVSGGEPFEQPDALEALLRAIRPRLAGDVLVYSGYPQERLAATLGRLDGLIDVLISDPYEATAGQTLALRGSDNQRMHLLTPIGQSRYQTLQHAEDTNEARPLDVLLDDDGDVWIAGIPRPRDMQRLRALLHQQGFTASTTEAAKKMDL